jgi:hypothetical protein
VVILQVVGAALLAAAIVGWLVSGLPAPVIAAAVVLLVFPELLERTGRRRKP